MRFALGGGQYISREIPVALNIARFKAFGSVTVNKMTKNYTILFTSTFANAHFRWSGSACLNNNVSNTARLFITVNDLRRSFLKRQMIWTARLILKAPEGAALNN